MKEENELLKKYGTQNPFTVPEGYFENFPKELMDKLPEKETVVQEEITLWQRVKPFVYLAAMFCGLMFSIKVFVGSSSQQDAPASAVATAETEQYSEEYIENILDRSMMDDYTLYQYLTDATTIDMYN